MNETATDPAKFLLRVFTRPLHPELLPTVATKRLRLPSAVADVSVAVGGHVVSVRVRDGHLCEVFGFGESEAFDRGAALTRTALRASSVMWSVPGLRYSASCSIDRVDPEVFEQLDREVRADGPSATLWVGGQGRNRLAATPVSSIRAEPLDGGLSVQTVHTFPAALTVVRVQSLFEVTVPA